MLCPFLTQKPLDQFCHHSSAMPVPFYISIRIYNLQIENIEAIANISELVHCAYII
jgi:hypothetical protein